MVASTKFNPSGYNDVGWGIAFLVHIVVVGAWIIFSAKSGFYQVKESSRAVVALYHGQALDMSSPSSEEAAVLALAFGSIGFGIIWAGIWLFALQAMPKEIVRASLLSGPVIFGALAIVLFAAGSVIGGVIFLLIAVLFAFLAWWYWDRVNFTASLLKAVSVTFQNASCIFLVGFGAMVAMALWLVFSVLALLPVMTGGFGLGVFFVFMVSFYWGFQVVASVLYVTCGGVCARYYYNEQVDSAVSSSLTQACTNYFGSICFGSLMIALIQAARSVVHMMKEQAGEDGNIAAVILLMVADCLLSYLEALAQFFNTWVFAYISVWGYTFSEASNKVWELLDNSDASCVLSYSLVGMVTFFACMSAGAFNAMMMALGAWRLGLGTQGTVIAAIVGFVIGYALMTIVSNMIEAGTTTIFVCWEDSRHLINRFDAELSAAISENLDGVKETQGLTGQKAH